MGNRLSNDFKWRKQELYTCHLIDPEISDKLRIYEFEENDFERVGSPYIFAKVTDDIFSQDTIIESQDLSHCVNYEKVPLLVIFHICYFLDVSDLFSFFRTCKYFNLCGKISNKFWKKYYDHYFKVNPSLIDRPVTDKKSFNWKKQFLKRYRCCPNDFYVTRQNPTFYHIEDRFIGVQQGISRSFRNLFLICGDKGIGKKTWMNRLFSEEYTPPESNKNICQYKEEDHRFFAVQHHPMSPHKEWTYENPRIGNAGGYCLGVPKTLEHLARHDRYLECYSKIFLNHAFGVGNEHPIQIIENLDTIKKIREHFSNDRIHWFSVPHFFFCFEVENVKSYENAKKYVDQFSDLIKFGLRDSSTFTKGLKYYRKGHPWSDKGFGILVGLKADKLKLQKTTTTSEQRSIIHHRNISLEEIKKYVKEKGLKGYIEVSAKEDCNCYLPFGCMVSKLSVVSFRIPG